MRRQPDGYSYHEITACDERGRVTVTAWTVIAEWHDESGDIEEVETVADYRTEAAAERRAARLNEGREVWIP